MYRYENKSLCEGRVSFSHDILAIISHNTVLVVKINTDSFEKKIVCSSGIHSVYISPDCEKILVLMSNQVNICLYKYNNLNNDNKMTSGFISLIGGEIPCETIMWSPDSVNCVLIGMCYSYALLWNTETGQIHTLDPPKSSCIMFSPNSDYLSIVIRRDGKDFLVLHDTKTDEVTDVQLNTLDSQKVSWSSDSTHICVLDSDDHDMLQIYDTRNQNLVESFLHEGNLGISSFAESENSKLIAVGGFDGIVRILVSPEWRVLAELIHSQYIIKEAQIFMQSEDGFEETESPIMMNTESESISHISWSQTNNFLVTLISKYPSSLFLWNVENFSLDCIYVFEHPIVNIKWSSTDDICAINTESSKLFVWKEHTMKECEGIMASDFTWCGKDLSIFDYRAGQVIYLQS